jgi:hypothetical protein
MPHCLAGRKKGMKLVDTVCFEGESILFLAAGEALLMIRKSDVKVLRFDHSADSEIVSIVVARSTNSSSSSSSSNSSSSSGGGGKVFAAFSNKHVCCWDINSGTVTSSILFKKNPSALVYGVFESTGQVYETIVLAVSLMYVCFRNEIYLSTLLSHHSTQSPSGQSW